MVPDRRRQMDVKNLYIEFCATRKSNNGDDFDQCMTRNLLFNFI